MIQVIYDDGTKERFTKEVIDRGKKISYQKVLTESEIKKIPEVKSKKLVMREKNATELKAEQDKVKLEDDKRTIENKIEAERRKMAIESMVASGKLTTEELTKIGE